MRNYSVVYSGVARYWWMPIITGLLAIGLGIWCLLSPTTSLPGLAWAFAIILCVAGAFNIIHAVANTNSLPNWGWTLAYGILEAGAGVWMLCLSVPVMTEVFIYSVGFYLIFLAIMGIVEMTSLYSYDSSWIGWLVALLLITLVFAIVFMAGPIAGGIAVWLWIGFAFIAFGFYRIFIAFRLRKMNRQ